MKIDGIDKIIIRNLIKDARTPVLSIAREVGISGAAIHQRLKKLEKSKLIDGYKTEINPSVLGYTITAFVWVQLDPKIDYDSIIKKIKSIPEIIECHYTSGQYSLLIKVLCKNNQHLKILMNETIQKINGIEKTDTYISLDQEFNRQIKL